MDFSKIVDVNLIRKLQEILPLNYKGVVISSEDFPITGLSCIIRLDIGNKEVALEWLKEYENKTKITLRVTKCFPENSEQLIFKKIYRCMHNTRPQKGRKAHPKHLNCNASLTMIVKNMKIKRSKDEYLELYPCQVTIRHNHNHPLNSLNMLKYRPVSKDVQTQFCNYFQMGHSPAAALNAYKEYLQEQHGDKYNEIVTDGQLYPPRRWVYELYYKIFQRGNTNSRVIEIQKECIDKYNKSCGDICAAISVNDNIMIAICSPIMKRVHEYIKTSSEIMFVDSSANRNGLDAKVYLFLCPSVVGALPLGILITYSELETVITDGIRLLQSILPNNCFYGNHFPNIIFSDDCDAERNSLKACFPNSTLLLCKFGIMQTTMKFLWNTNNNVDQHDSFHIYTIFRIALNCLDEIDFLSTYEALLNEPCFLTNTKLLMYFEKLLDNSQLWAPCHVNKLIPIDNYTATTYRILKDSIWLKGKVFNAVQLIENLTTFDQQYFKRIVDISNGNQDHSKLYNRYVTNISTTANFQYTDLGSNLYLVICDTQIYVVNNELEMCTCDFGKNCVPCKHQYFIDEKCGLLEQFHPMVVDSSFKVLLYQIVNGCESHIQDCATEENLADVAMDDISDTDLQVTDFENNTMYNNLQDFTDSLIEQHKNNFDEFDEAIKVFLKNIELCRTNGSLINALYNFGK